jgi:hypothetical protein
VSGWPRPRRLRARLTAWYLSMLALVLAIFVVGTSWVMYTQLRAELVRYIVQDLDTIEGLITFDQYGHPYFREQHHDQTESRFVLDRYFEMIASDGSVLYRNERLGDTGLDGADPVSDSDDAISERVGRLQDGTRVMVVSRRHIFEGQPPVVMRLGYSRANPAACVRLGRRHARFDGRNAPRGRHRRISTGEARARAHRSDGPPRRADRSGPPERAAPCRRRG